jgi:acetolactate synthase-1/2/3 large subunit
MTPRYGSDLIVDILPQCDIRHAALNRAASLCGIHDSPINYLLDQIPEFLEYTDKEISVAMAHGYVRASGFQLSSCANRVISRIDDLERLKEAA